MQQRILLIEDESDVRETLAEILMDEGFHVTQAPEGKSGLEKLKAEHFDLILLDLMMPIMDGNEFLEQAHSADLPLPPVIVLTALNPGRIPGVANQLRKPYRISDLFAAINEVLC